jgi:hypothetical protein
MHVLFFLAATMLFHNINKSMAFRLHNTWHQPVKLTTKSLQQLKQTPLGSGRVLKSILRCRGGNTVDTGAGITGTCIGIDLGTTYR